MTIEAATIFSRRLAGCDDPIEAELTDFAKGALDPAQFPHREHLRFAFEMLARYPFGETVTRFGAGLRLLAAKAGRPELYHETKTVAFLAAIAERRARGGEKTWEEFAAANRDLADKSYLDRFYRRNELKSDLARRVFLLPQPERGGGGGRIAPVANAYAVIFSLFIAYSSAMTLRTPEKHLHVHAALLATIEMVAAFLFCLPRLRAAGLVLLLAVFLGASTFAMMQGKMPFRFIYHTSSALLVWWLTPSEESEG